MDEVLDRPFFQRRLREEIARSARFDRPFVLLILEAHRTDNLHLKHKLALGLDVLRRSLREYDLAYKVFDDTLAAVLLETDLVGAKAALQRITARLSFRAGRWSIHVYPFPECADQIRELPALLAA